MCVSAALSIGVSDDNYLRPFFLFFFLVGQGREAIKNLVSGFLTSLTNGGDTELAIAEFDETKRK